MDRPQPTTPREYLEAMVVETEMRVEAYKIVAEEFTKLADYEPEYVARHLRSVSANYRLVIAALDQAIDSMRQAALAATSEPPVDPDAERKLADLLAGRKDRPS